MWRAFASVSVACDLIELHVPGQAEPGGSEWGQGPGFPGVNLELQKVGFLLDHFCFSKVLGALWQGLVQVFICELVHLCTMDRKAKQRDEACAWMAGCTTGCPRIFGWTRMGTDRVLERT